MKKHPLTKESITKLFPNNFVFANFAMEVAQKEILSGKEGFDVTELLERMQREEEQKRKKTPTETG